MCCTAAAQGSTNGPDRNPTEHRWISLSLHFQGNQAAAHSATVRVCVYVNSLWVSKTFSRERTALGLGLCSSTALGSGSSCSGTNTENMSVAEDGAGCSSINHPQGGDLGLIHHEESAPSTGHQHPNLHQRDTKFCYSVLIKTKINQIISFMKAKLYI